MTGRTRTITWDDPAATAGGLEGRSGLEFLRALQSGELPAAPIGATMGMRLESVEEGRVVFALDVAEWHFNPIGSVHGGVYATLLDSCCGCSVHSRLPAGVGYTSLDLAVKFLAPIRPGDGTVTATGAVTHLGRRTALATGELRAGDRLCATATSTCLIFGG